MLGGKAPVLSMETAYHARTHTHMGQAMQTQSQPSVTFHKFICNTRTTSTHPIAANACKWYCVTLHRLATGSRLQWRILILIRYKLF